MLDLTPFASNGFISQWIKFMQLMHPDVTKNDLEAVKIAGAMLLVHSTGGIFYNDFGCPPATLYAVLIGRPRTGKGTILRAVESTAAALGINVVGDTTPEALAAELELEPNTIQIWQDVGNILRRHSLKDQYLGLDKLLNNTFNLSTIRLRRKQAKNVYVPSRSYLFSMLWDTTPQEWGAVEDILGGPTGFARRVLPIRMSDAELPYFSCWEPTPEAAEYLAAMKRARDILYDKVFLVNLKALNIFEEKVHALQSYEERSRIADYTKRLTAIAIVDSVIDVIHEKGVCEVHLNPNSLYNTNNTITLITHKHNITTYNIYNKNDVSVIGSALTAYNILTKFRSFVLADEDIQRFAEETRTFLAKRGAATKREWWLQVCKGRKKKFVEEVLATLSGLGVVIIRTTKQATYIVNPAARICGACAFFGTSECKMDPNKEGCVGIMDEPCDIFSEIK